MKNAQSALIFILVASVIIGIPLLMSSHKPKEVALTVAFYNVENLFDTVDDRTINDNEFLPASGKQWNTEKYHTKLNNLGYLIKQISRSGEKPDLLGLAEVENRKVLEDLIRHNEMPGYGIVHDDSPDRRGIDVALLYNMEALKVIAHRSVNVPLTTGNPTRDILYAVMVTNDNDILHVLVNHWPSRSGGHAKSAPRRLEAAAVAKNLVDSLLSLDTLTQIIVMGDFNDGPSDPSVAEILDAGDHKNNTLFNPYLALSGTGKGSYLYRGKWMMIDQIVISRGLWDYSSLDYIPESGTVFDKPWLRQQTGKYKEYPLRTFGGQNYLGGYSDHFPVVIELYQTRR